MLHGPCRSFGSRVAQINKENTGQPAKFEFQMINLFFFSFSVSMSPEIHNKNYFYNYLKFKFNWIPRILSGNPTWSYLLRCSVVLVISQSWRGRDWEWHWEGWEDEKGGTHPQPILQNRTEAQVLSKLKRAVNSLLLIPLNLSQP